jgi:apolipoprotein N-acyltransferase
VAPHFTRALVLSARLAAAITSGLGIALALSPYDFHYFAPIAVALFIWSIWQAGLISTILLTFAANAALYWVVVSWLSKIGFEAVVFASTAYGVVSAAGAGILFYFSLRAPLWPIWVASVWVFREALIDRWPFGGFGWGQLAYSQAITPLASYAAIGSTALVTFVTALLGALMAYAALALWGWRGNRRVSWRRLLVTPVCAAVIGVIAVNIPLPTVGESNRGDAVARITLVQGGGEQIPGNDPLLDKFPATLANVLQLTRDYAFTVRSGDEEPPDFVVWAENAASGQFFANAEADTAMQQVVDYLGQPVLAASAVRAGGDGWYNSSILWLPEEGPIDFYYKRHLVPFAEYIPFGGAIGSAMNRFRISQGFFPGDRPGYFDIDGVAVSTAICFEISDSRVIREAVLQGGRVIVLQSSNYGFIYRGQADQQFAIARMRAIEHGRSVIASGISGPSGFISPNGQVIKVLPEGAVGIVTANVPLRDSLTIADRLGGAPEAVLALLWLLGAVLFWRTKRKRTRSNAVAESEPAS